MEKLCWYAIPEIKEWSDGSPWIYPEVHKGGTNITIFLPQFLSVSLKLEMYCISLSIHERCVTASYQRSMSSPITELSQSGRTVALILTLSMI